MTDLISPAVEWLASSGAPNWLVLVFILTSPWSWARRVRERVGGLVDQLLPGGGGE